MSNKNNNPDQGNNNPDQGNNNPKSGQNSNPKSGQNSNPKSGQNNKGTTVVMLRTVDMGKAMPAPLGKPHARHHNDLSQNSLVVGGVYSLSPTLVNVENLITAGLARKAEESDLLVAKAEKLKAEEK